MLFDTETDMVDYSPKPTANLWFSLVTLVVLLSGLAFIAWIVFQGFVSLAGVLPGSNFAPVAVLVTGLLSLFGTLSVAYISYRSLLKTKIVEKQKDLDQELRKEKAPTYEEFVAFLFKIMRNQEARKPLSDQQMLEFILKFNQRLLVWGGDPVIRAWSNFKVGAFAGETTKLVFSVEDILFAIRADMGHPNEGLKRGDLSAIYINDIQTILEGQPLPSADEILKTLKS